MNARTRPTFITVTFWLVALLCLLTGRTTCADDLPLGLDAVFLQNGDRISGVLLTADNHVVQLRTSAFGDLTIRWSEIMKVVSQNKGWRIGMQGRRDQSSAARFQSAVLRVQQDTLIIEAESGTIGVPSGQSVKFMPQEHSTGLPQLMGMNPPPKTGDTSFAISVSAPQSVIVGTTNQQLFGGSLRVLYREPDQCAPPSWFAAFLVAANHNKNYKVGSQAIVTDTFDGTISLLEELNARTGIDGYLVADLFGNSSLGIGLQQSYGFGVSRVIFSNACHGIAPMRATRYRLSVNGDASVRYIYQRLYAPGTSGNLAGSRLAETAVWTPLFKDSSGVPRERFSVDQSLWATPMFGNSRAIQAGGTIGISFPLGSLVSIGLSEEDDYFNNAPRLRRKNFLKSALSFTVAFPPSPK